MAREVRKAVVKGKSVKVELPFTSGNFYILGIGILIIALGYVALAQEPWDNFFAIVIAPIVLLIGYCIVIPLGILYKNKKENGQSSPHTAE